MGVNYNPTVVLDGLEFSLDFANRKNYSYNVHPFPSNITRWMSVNSGLTSNCTISEDATQISPTGGIPMRMVSTGADAHISSYSASKWNLAPANTGEVWTASVWVKANTSVTIERPYVFGANSSGVWNNNDDIATSSVAIDTNWKRLTTTLSMSSANTRFVQVRLDGPHTFTPATVWWDGLQVEKVASASDFNPKTNINGNNATETLSSGDFTFHGDDYWSHTPPGTLVEPERTNFVRNNTMQGAVAGTPGTEPTNWASSGSGSGVTREIVGVGTENGIAYADVRFYGTPTAGTSVSIGFEQTNQIAATAGQTWTESVFVKLQAGSFTNTSTTVSLLATNGVSGIEAFNSTAITSTPADLRNCRLTMSGTLAAALGTTHVQPRIRIGYTVGVAFDITLRIGMPQMELGSTVTSVIPTKTEARTRYPQQEGTITFDRTLSTSQKFGGGARRTMTGNLAAKEFLYKNHTWEIWFRINDRAFGGYGDATETFSSLMRYRGYHAGFGYNASSLIYEIWYGTSSANTVCSWTVGASGAQINQGSWYQLAVTRNDNVFTPYINGVQLGTGGTFVTSNVGVLTSDQLWLGKTGAVAANTGQYLAYSKNTVGAVKMYTRALSASEILQNFNALRGRYGV